MSDEKFQNKYRIQSARATWHHYSGGAYFITIKTKNGEHYFGEIVVETGRGNDFDVETGRSNDFDVETGRSNDFDVETGRSNDFVVETGRSNDFVVETGRAPSLQIPTIQLSPIGQFLYDNLQQINNHYPYAEIPLFVVMPNHVHAVVLIDGDHTPYIRGNDVDTWHSNFVETGRSNDVVETGRSNDVVETGRSNDDVDTGRSNDVVETGRAPSLQTETTTEKMKIIDSCKGWLSVAIGGLKSAVTKFANENGIDFAWQTRFFDRIIRDQEEMNRIGVYIEDNIASWANDCYNKKNNKNDNKQ